MNEYGNRLLAGLPFDELDQLWPMLERIDLPFRAVLHTPDQPIFHVYFPETGCLSRMLVMADRSGSEIGFIGSEGMAGIAVLLGSDRESFETTVQIAGTALRMDVAMFSHALDSMAGFRRKLLRYVLAHLDDVARTGACNTRHHIDQRLARWLLVAQDRVGRDEFSITHEALSEMLGVRRAGISVAAAQLRSSGYIRYERGRLTIIDRPGLERISCECYAVTRRISPQTVSSLEPVC